MMDAIGVREAQLLEVVRRAGSDDDVAAWLRDHADRSKDEASNKRMSRRSYADVADKARFDSNYPLREKSGLTNCFDIMEADDRATFPDS